MSLKLSTALRNFLLANGSLKEAFDDGVLRIYSGSPPTYSTASDADAAITGTLLLEVATSSGTVATTDISIPKRDTLTVGSNTDAQTFIVTINSEVAASVTASSDTTTTIAAKLAKILQQNSYVDVYYPGAAIIDLQSKFPGITYSLSASGSTGTLTPTAINATTTYYGLHFGTVTTGVLAKGSGVWSGAGKAAAGTGTAAGYFRLVRPDDSGSLEAGTPPNQLRLQGTVGTSGTDLIMSSTTIVSGATTTVDSFSITMPISL